MNASEQREIIESYIAAYNSFDIEGMLALLHPDILFQNIAEGNVTAETKGIDPFRELAYHAKELFSSRTQTPSNFTTNGQHTEVEIAFGAVLAVDLPNGMKQGELLKLNGRSEFDFSDGKIIAIRDIS